MAEGSPESKRPFKKISTKDEGYQERQAMARGESVNRVLGADIAQSYELARAWDSSPQFLQTTERASLIEEVLSESAKAIEDKIRESVVSKIPSVRHAASAYLENGLIGSDNAYNYFDNWNRLRTGAAPQENVSTIERLRQHDWIGERAPTSIADEERHIRKFLLRIQANKIADHLKQGFSCPPEFWAEIVLGNKKTMEECQQKLESRYEASLRAGFKARLPALAKRYGMPLDKIAAWEALVDGIAVRVVDDLSANIEEVGGIYSHDSNEIHIAAQYIVHDNPEALEEIYAHEMLHALSGRLIYSNLAGTASNEPGLENYDVNRIGLGFAFPRSGRAKARFGWLNEAMTERLTVDMVKKKGRPIRVPSYVAEMEILKFLCEKGSKKILLKRFVQAFFENYEPPGEATKPTIPAWRALRKEINESFDPAFLIQLDNRIGEIGATEALEELRTKRNI